MLQLPRAARLTIWFNAWLLGATSTDSARDGVVGSDVAHHLTGLPDDPEPVPLVLALGRLRNLGATDGRLALPAPGDPLGLAGPTAFNEHILEAGEGCVLSGCGLGLVPFVVGAGVFWRAQDAACAPSPPDLPEADRDLRATFVRTADQLAELNLAEWRPDMADALLDLRSTGAVTEWAPGYQPRARAVATAALRALAIISLAAGDGRFERAVLAPLDRAARRALVAACAPPPRSVAE
jgi:hypothetical protein